MRAVILNGARRQESFGDHAQSVLTEELTTLGWHVDGWLLRKIDIEPCRGCFECWVRSPGLCTRSEPANDIARSVIGSDLAIFLTRITFGGYSSELKKALDHLIGLLSPMFARVGGEVHHRRRYARYPRLLGVGLTTAPDPESEEVFTSLIARNALNLHSPNHAAWVLPEEGAGSTIRIRLAAFVRSQGVAA